jgi:hypothetical protein
MALTKVTPSMIEGSIDDKLTYAIILGAPLNVLDYGAVGDGVADDTVPLQTAFAAAATSGNTLFIPVGTYRITAQISVTATAIFNWSASNAKILVDSPASIESAIKIEVAGNNIFLNGSIEIDCNNKSYAGLLVLNNNATFCTCVIDGPIIRNVYRTAQVFTYGDGIYVFGAYERVVIRNFEIHSVKMAVGAGVPFSYGVTGVTVFRFNNSTRDAESVLIEDFYIDKVYSEDVTYGARDQDGVRVTQAYEKEQVSEGTNPVFALVQNGRIKNAHGRAVKMVSEYGIVQNIEVVRDTTIYSSFSPGSSEDFDFQVSGGSLAKIRCYYNNNCPESVATFAIAITDGRRAPTKVDVSDVIVSAFTIVPNRLADVSVVTAPIAPPSVQINISSVQIGGTLSELDEVLRLVNANDLPDTFVWNILLTSVSARVTNSFVYRNQATIANTIGVTGINCWKSNSGNVPLATGVLTTNISSFLVGYNLRLT